MQQTETYRCEGCGTVFRVAGGDRPTVVCSECEQVASPHGDAAAKREYRVGHATYVEGRRRTTEALERFESGHTTLARGGFDDAAGELEDSVDRFTAAVTRADSEAVREDCERARKKATCLWQAVEWLSGATYASEKGDADRATRYRKDAQQRLRAASEYDVLTAPDELTD
ncbi:hypothetical protein [Haloarcula laminariae]|uniref:hypothetical protein n=1 Tax=Haloarcula laminariae TaxID=2961577 RepID=UPI0021C596F9|nr:MULTISPECIES: hypothetical protein [Halomicroarcula]